MSIEGVNVPKKDKENIPDEKELIETESNLTVRQRVMSDLREEDVTTSFAQGNTPEELRNIELVLFRENSNEIVFKLTIGGHGIYIAREWIGQKRIERELPSYVDMDDTFARPGETYSLNVDSEEVDSQKINPGEEPGYRGLAMRMYEKYLPVARVLAGDKSINERRPRDEVEVESYDTRAEKLIEENPQLRSEQNRQIRLQENRIKNEKANEKRRFIEQLLSKKESK
ncbi:MAG: hypothetical protein KBC35_00595 [Candidatus Pacebacteria bacterium]|nr:hypothetical protein [Candidatus Paceibacterota bacterium]